jgi:hypothetical protein
MNYENTKSRRSVAMIAIGLIGIVITIGGLYFFDQIRTNRQASVPPNPEWTTAPKGGVDVNLPETPITIVPVAPPVMQDEVQATGTDKRASQPPQPETR